MSSHSTEDLPVLRCGDIAGDRSRLIVIATFAVIAAALIAPLVSLGQWMWGMDHYQHFPLLLIAALVLAVHRWRQQEVEFIGSLSVRVLIGLMAAVALTVVVFVLPSRWSASLAGVCLLAAMINFVGGRSWMRSMLGPLMLVAAAVPLPMGIDERLLVWLRQVATYLSSSWLDLAGVMHLCAGVSIQTPTQDYFVEDACSGIHSVFAAIAVGVGYGAIRQYSVCRVLAIVGQLLMWVILTNGLRVFLTVYGQSQYGYDLSGPVIHETLGLMTFACGLLLALSGDHLLRYARPLVDPDLNDLERASIGDSPGPSWWDRALPGPATASMVGGLAVVVIVLGVMFTSRTAAAGRSLSIEELAALTVIDLNSVSEDLLPEELSGWKRLGFVTETRGPDSVFGGMVGLRWQYSNGARVVAISLDGPYQNWHDLAVCYRGSGWDVAAMRPVSGYGDNQAEFVVSELMMEREPLESAQVLFACIDPAGSYVAPPAFYGLAPSGIIQRFGFGIQDQAGFQGGVVQLQLMDLRVSEPISESAKTENLQLLRAAAQIVFRPDDTRPIESQVTEPD